MHFSITTGEKPHKLDDKERKTIDSSVLKTWLYRCYQDFYGNSDDPPPPPQQPSLPRSSGTPARPSGVKELETSTRPNSSVKSADQVNAALELDIVRSRLCPFPLLVDVEKKDKLCEIADNIRSSNEYNHMVEGLREESTKQKYRLGEKVMAERLVKVLNAILAQTSSKDISDKFVNLENKTVKFTEDAPDSSTSTSYVTKPDIILVPTPDSNPNLWRNVTAAIELKAHCNDDLSTDLLQQTSRYALAMIYCRPFSAVTYTMTITGNIARMYRYDAQSFCLTEGAIITDPEGFRTFCKYIAFMAHPDRQNECFRPATEFEVQCKHGTIKKYEIPRGDLELLFSRLRLFGSRTACFSGEVREVSGTSCEACSTKRPIRASSTKRRIRASITKRPIRPSRNKILNELIHVIIKLSWLAPKFEQHELDVLQRLQSGLSSASLLKVPRPLGTLYGMNQDFLNACMISSVRPQLPHGNELPLRCVSLVTECPKGTELDGNSDVLEIVIVFKNLAEILLDVAKAGIQYRDFNLGNILRTGDLDSPDCLLIDFGNARIGRNPRGHSDPHPNTEVAQDDFRSCTEAFSSIASMKAAQLTKILLADQCDLKEAEALQDSSAIKMNKSSIKSTEKELTCYVLHHFDDLQSAFFVFLCLLGQKSIKPKEVLTSLEDKERLLLKGLKNNRWLEFKPLVKEVIRPLVVELIKIVHPENRLQVLKESEKAQDPSCLTKTETKCFLNWIKAFEETIPLIRKLRDDGELV